MKIIDGVRRYINNFRPRHANTINFFLHLIGIPEVFFGLFQSLTGNWKAGFLNIFFGYLWQWMGHRYFEKNEIGEITGIKTFIEKLTNRPK